MGTTDVISAIYYVFYDLVDVKYVLHRQIIHRDMQAVSEVCAERFLHVRRSHSRPQPLDNVTSDNK